MICGAQKIKEISTLIIIKTKGHIFHQMKGIIQDQNSKPSVKLK
jgi:hypothetical protein